MEIGPRRSKWWDAISDSILTIYSYNKLRNPRDDEMLEEGDPLSEYDAAYGGNFVIIHNVGERLLEEYDDFVEPISSGMSRVKASEVLSDAWRQLLTQMEDICKNPKHEQPIQLSPYTWEALTLHDYVERICSLYNTLVNEELPQIPKEPKLELKRQFIEEHRIKNLFDENTWSEKIIAKNLTIQDFINKKLDVYVVPHKKDLPKEMRGIPPQPNEETSLETQKNITVHSEIVTKNNTQDPSQNNNQPNSAGTESVKSEETQITVQNTPIINEISNQSRSEETAQKTAKTTDTFTRATKSVKNAPTKDQEWHLSKDLECVTVW